MILGGIGCSDDDDVVVTEVKVTQDTFCTEVAKLLCRNMFACCTGNEIEDILGITISTEEKACQHDMELVCEDRNYELLDAVVRGTVTVHEQVATDCLNAMFVKDGRCFLNRPEAPWAEVCKEGLYEGNQAPDQPCFASIECKADSYCAGNQKCKALPKKDEKCPDGHCATGLSCQQPGAGGDRVCTELRKKDETCNVSMPCQAGLYCDINSGEAEGKCAPQKKKDEACSASNQCDTGYCVPGTCSDGRECTRDEQCPGKCAESQEECFSALQCPGKCSVSGDACTSPLTCTGTEETCDREECVTRCEGDRVCAEQPRKIDYCSDPMQLLLPGG